MSESERIFASTTPGLEPALAREARALGVVHEVVGGVELEGAPGLHRLANLELRTASRVMLELARFTARDAASLRAGLAKVRWDGVLPAGERLALDLVSRQSRHSASALRSAIPKSWPAGKGAVEARVRAEGEQVVVSVDSSGELLHRRGYRQEISHAPLRESLAAGILLLAEYDPRRPLWDPMCGSGTLAIEAAHMAQERAPGLERAFAFEKWPMHDAAAWQQERDAARHRIRSALPSAVHASDKNAGALGVAKRNARRGGVEELIQFARHDATRPMQGLDGPGLLIANLPYGKRVGDEGELRVLYRGFASALKESLRGWRVAWLVADAKLLEVGIAWTSRRAIDNGGIRCTLAIGTV